MTFGTPLLVLGLCLLFSATPTSAMATPFSAAPLPAGLHPLTTNDYGNSSAYTADANTSDNVGFNFTVDTGTYDTILSLPIALPSGGNLTVTGGELINRTVGDAYVGFNAINTGSGTVIHPVAILPNGSYVLDPSVTLATGGAGSLSPWTFRFAHTGGDWWTFSYDSQPIVPTTGGNGTYNLSYAFAVGYTSFGGRAGTGPTLRVDEEMIGTATGIPFTSAEAAFLLRPALAVNQTASTSYDPVSGIYRNATISTKSIPMLGANQSKSLGIPIPGDLVLVNPPSPANTYATTTNDACLWGSCPPGTTAPTVHEAKSWLGAYTTDPDYTNVTGIRAAVTVPSALPPEDQSLFDGVVLPVNGSTDIAVGFADVNISFGGIINYQGVFPEVGVYNPNTHDGTEYALYIDLNALTAGSEEVLDLVDNGTAGTGSYWWYVTLNGLMLNDGWETVAASGEGVLDYGNGTFLLNASAFWADNLRTPVVTPFGRAEIEGLGIPLLNTTATTLAFFGNQSKYIENTSMALLTANGWGVPVKGYAFSYYPGDEIVLGAEQWSPPWMDPGALMVVNATFETSTGPKSQPLDNLTLLWSAMQVTGTATPSTIYGSNVSGEGGETTIALSVLDNGVGVSGATLTGCGDSADLGACSALSGGTGSYSLTFTTTKAPTHATTDTLTITLLSTTYGTGVGTVSLQVLPPVSIAVNTVQGGATIPTVTPGGSVTLNIWTNASNGAPADVGAPQASPESTGWANVCAIPTEVSTGYYQCTVSVLSSATLFGDESLTVATLQSDGVNLVTAQTEVNVVEPTLTVSSPSFGPAIPASGYVAGTFVNISATVTSDGNDVAGIEVNFTFSQPIPSFTWPSGSGNYLHGTTDSSGVATVMLHLPSSLTSSTSFNAGASAITDSYKVTTSPAVTFSVNAPVPTSSNNTSSNSGLSSLELYGILGVVAVVAVLLVVVLMLKRKKGGSPPPQAWSAQQPSPMGETAPEGASEPPA